METRTPYVNPPAAIVTGFGGRSRQATSSRPSGSVEPRKRITLPTLLLAITTVAIYLPVHEHPFTNIDDPQYVTDNVHIQKGVTASTAFWAFTHVYAANWHPLTWLSHALDIQLFGLDPAPHHDENVLLHALNAVLLFWILLRATKSCTRSFMVSALFAVHPLNVESVAWVAERKTMLCSLFFLLALGAYRWYASAPSRGRYTVVAALFVLGLLCKPQIIMFPFVLLLWDYWPLQRTPDGETESKAPGATVRVTGIKHFRWLVREKLPLFLISLVDGALTMIAQQHVVIAIAFPTRIENAVVSYIRYIEKAFWPSSLALCYPHPGKWLHWWEAASALLFLASITALTIQARRHRYLLVGWLWFLIMLLPMIGFIQVGQQAMADRYAYLSFIGLFLVVCWGLADWAAERHLPRLLLPAVSVAALLALTAVTRRQIGYWSDNVTLWAHSAGVSSSGNWEAEYFEGLSLQENGQCPQALQHYFRTAAINPSDVKTHFGIAICEQNEGQFAIALEHYTRALAEAWNADQRRLALANMAAIYRQLGEYGKADKCLAQIKQLPEKTVDWQGAWWKQIVPMIRQYFHARPAATP
jgi:tetratricopeptide (TPR) repeat protein